MQSSNACSILAEWTKEERFRQLASQARCSELTREHTKELIAIASSWCTERHELRGRLDVIRSSFASMRQSLSRLDETVRVEHPDKMEASVRERWVRYEEHARQAAYGAVSPP